VAVLGSLKLTTILLAYFFVLLLAGTLFQATNSVAEMTNRFVYAWLLWVGPVPLPAAQPLFLLAFINLVAGALIRIPFRVRAIGLWMIHVALALAAASLLVGSFREESVLVLRPGETSGSSFTAARTASQTPQEESQIRTIELPFTVTLLEFLIEFHPGTRTPSTVTSRIRVEAESALDLTLGMNRPARVGDYTIYQLGYASDGPEQAYLQVVQNPLRSAPYVIGGLLAVGLLIHVGIELARRSRKKRNAT
jgi:hypothetical protein